MNAVANGFELGRLVDHIFGRGDLATIVQPTGDMQGLPLRVVQVEMGPRRVLAAARRFGQHPGQIGYALAVPAGVRAFGVNGAGDQLNKSFEQVLLLLDQPVAFNGQRRAAGDRFHQRHHFGSVFAGVFVFKQQQDAHGLFLAVFQRDGQRRDVFFTDAQRAKPGHEFDRFKPVAEGALMQGAQDWVVMTQFFTNSRNAINVIDALAIPQGLRRGEPASFCFAQIKNAAARAHDAGRFAQDARQQSVEIALRSQGQPDVEKAAYGVLGVLRGLRQFIDFLDQTGLARRIGKTKVADLGAFAGDALQRSAQAARLPPNERQKGSHDQECEQKRLPANVFYAGQQLVFRDGEQ